MMTRLLMVLLCLWGGMLSAAADLSGLLTKAESSGFRATGGYTEVMAFCEALAEESSRVRLHRVGPSGEGREIPLLILSETGIEAPDDKVTILCVGAIHGGEVCGKEALLMLARDLAGAEAPGVLGEVNVLMLPLYNVDGNEAMAADNRPGQLGPEEGMGERENAHGLDLNRDFIKAEAPETRALLRILEEWDPAMVIDTHTTNGSHHRYTLTYGGPRHPNTDPRLLRYVRDRFLPKVGKRLQRKTGYAAYAYGNFAQNHERWETYPAWPRYGAHYLGMRHVAGILSEAYAYAGFEDRVRATEGFVRACLHRASKGAARLGKIVEKASAPPVPGEHVVLRHVDAPFPEKRVIQGWEEDGGEVTSTPRDYWVEEWGDTRPVLEVALPHAYLIPEGEQAVVTLLRRHGIEVEVLREDVLLQVTRQRVRGVEVAAEAFEGHHLRTITAVGLRTEEAMVPAGTRVIYTEQKLGRLAAFMLEPEAEDGLATWGILPVTAGEDFAVARLQGEAVTSLLTRALPPLAEERAKKRPITWETLHGEDDVDLNGQVTSITWLESGGEFLQMRDETLHRVEAITGRSEPFFEETQLAASVRALPGVSEDEVTAMAKRQDWRMNPGRTAGLLSYHEDLYEVSFAGEPSRRLTSSVGEETLATYSPDGRFVAFVRDDNLMVTEVATGIERALTVDGGGAVSNGKADWVYYEELYGRDWRAFWWSPDSRRLAFHRFDRSGMPTFHALDTLPLHGRLESMPHPKPGDPNPEVALGVVHVAGGEIAWADLSDYTPGTYVVSRVGWLPEGEAVYAYVQDRTQRWLDFVVYPAEGGEGERWFRETSEAWVESPGAPFFLEDGLLWPSERDGWRHLYRYRREQDTWETVTRGEWEVREVHRMDVEGDVVWFSGTKDTSLGEQLYVVGLGDGEVRRLTASGGHHEVQVAPDGSGFVDRWSDRTTPPRLSLRDSAGELLRVLDSNPVFALEDFCWAESTLERVPTEGGGFLEAILTKPLDWSAGEEYPAWVRTYGGPHAPVVSEGWSRAALTEQMLAGMGLMVLRVDPHSASGKGARSAWSAYKQLGVKELEDLETAVEWLVARGDVDPERVGLHGHSYGGFLTAYAMTHSTMFAAGIAGAPVTDWRNYDSIYTERYMGTPEENPEGYARSSVVEAAGDLHGELLLLHGMMDDNVHLQNSTQLIEALQAADKDFRVMFYPTMRHGLHGKHYQRLLTRFVEETVLGDRK